MADLVRVKNTIHGGVTALPESALVHLPNWEPVDGPTPATPKASRSTKSQSTNAASAASTEQE